MITTLCFLSEETIMLLPYISVQHQGDNIIVLKPENWQKSTELENIKKKIKEKWRLKTIRPSKLDLSSEEGTIFQIVLDAWPKTELARAISVFNSRKIKYSFLYFERLKLKKIQ